MKYFKNCLTSTAIALALSSVAQVANADVTIGIAACCSHGQTSTMDRAETKWRQMADEKGVKVLYENAAEAENDDKTLQYQQIKKMIDEGAQAILFMPVQGDGVKKVQKEVFDYAQKKKIPLIAYNREPSQNLMKRYKNLYYVGSAPAQGGVYHGEMIVQLVKKHPEWDKNKDGEIAYGHVRGVEKSGNEVARTTWVVKTLNNYPGFDLKFKEVANESAQWKRSMAENLTTRWLNGGIIDQLELIIVNSDDMALGVLDAFKKANVQPIPITSINALPAVREAIDKGEIAGSVYQNIEAQQIVGFNLALNLIAGKKANDGMEDVNFVGNTVAIPFEIVTKENVDKYLNK